jgi:hypothetical protein
MPEMVPYCGRRFQVVKVAHKTCDASGWEYLRSLNDAVHLETRCDGGGHGGCQAGCLLFWKTAWLRKLDVSQTPLSEHPIHEETEFGVPERVSDAARKPDAADKVIYRCQATEIKHATMLLRPWNAFQYVQDVQSGNVAIIESLKYSILALLKTAKVTGRLILKKVAPASRKMRKSQVLTDLNLKEGDTVRIKARHEIMATLNSDWKNFGLSFEADMKQYCGSQRTVAKRIERIIDEKDGRMIEFKRPCWTLNGVYCTGRDCRTRLFCPRGMQSFWRENWLERADE